MKQVELYLWIGCFVLFSGFFSVSAKAENSSELIIKYAEFNGRPVELVCQDGKAWLQIAADDYFLVDDFEILRREVEKLMEKPGSFRLRGSDATLHIKGGNPDWKLCVSGEHYNLQKRIIFSEDVVVDEKNVYIQGKEKKITYCHYVARCEE
ncbi:MAG: hypothetical protein ACD_11C00134G0004 [uncultured bacterium]|nr:MAG: hypothetical protein ACD_11C00134G0004 [uncultured bacterium]HBR71979.1 hypothetical protein [Candidatus Moranbacteria bacterium]